MAIDGAEPAAEGRSPKGLVDEVSLLARATVGTYALIAAVLVGLLVSNQVRFEPRVRDSIEAARLLRVSHEAMLDQDTGLRAYLMAGDDRFLEAYQRGRDQLDAVDEASDERLGRGSTAPLYLDLRLARQAWLDVWIERALAEGARADGSTEAQGRQNVLLFDGKRLFDEYREAYAALSQHVLVQREAALDARERALQLTAGTALLAAVVLGGIAAHRIRRLRLSVAGPMASILDHLDHIRAGRLDDVHPRHDGLREFKIIDDGLTSTAADLRRARAQAADHAQHLAQQNDQLAEVLRFAREVAGSLNLRYVLQGLCDAVAAISGGQRVVVWLRSDGADDVEAVADSSAPKLADADRQRISLGEGAVGRAARFGRMEGRGRGPLDGHRVADELAIPMVVGAEVTGVLQLTGPGVASLPSETVDILEALAVQAASAVSAARLHEHTEVLAMSDALTHLPNRRRLEVDLATEVSISSRHGRPLGFAMVDVDHFKAYNDTMGHQAADVALQELADLLAGNSREGDTVYRYGGEELAVVMRETPAEGAAGNAERLRKLVEHHFADPRQPRAVTVSIGVASMPEHGRSAAALVQAADQALYAAKHSGRNRVGVADARP